MKLWQYILILMFLSIVSFMSSTFMVIDSWTETLLLWTTVVLCVLVFICIIFDPIETKVEVDDVPEYIG